MCADPSFEIESGMRIFLVASALVASVASFAAIGMAQAAECPGHPNALGVSRTIVLDPAQHPRLGTLQYDESLPLEDHEIVLTFDDGPLPPNTNRVLDALAAECVKATFFLIGKMALGYPHVVQREYAEGHTIAGHSQNHPLTFAKMTAEEASHEIEDGFESLRTVLGDPSAVAPFFRIPGLLRQDSVEDYLASHGYATFSLDFLADDWTHIGAKEIVRRALKRIDARGRGILLLHDIQPATAMALPTLLAELKARGYKIVQVIPATPERPATVADAGAWVQSHHARLSWPHVMALGSNGDPPSLDVPSPEDVGVVANPPGEILEPGLRASLGGDAGSLPHLPAWPSHAKFKIPPDIDVLPIPDDQDFIYLPVRPLSAVHASVDRRALRKKFGMAPRLPKPGAGAQIQSVSKAPVPAHGRPIGHQLNLPKPTANL